MALLVVNRRTTTSLSVTRTEVWRSADFIDRDPVLERDDPNTWVQQLAQRWVRLLSVRLALVDIHPIAAQAAVVPVLPISSASRTRNPSVHASLRMARTTTSPTAVDAMSLRIMAYLVASSAPHSGQSAGTPSASIERRRLASSTSATARPPRATLRWLLAKVSRARRIFLCAGRLRRRVSSERTPTNDLQRLLLASVRQLRLWRWRRRAAESIRDLVKPISVQRSDTSNSSSLPTTSGKMRRHLTLMMALLSAPGLTLVTTTVDHPSVRAWRVSVLKALVQVVWAHGVGDGEVKIARDGIGLLLRRQRIRLDQVSRLLHPQQQQVSRL